MTWNVEHFDILEHKTHPEVKQKMIDLINQFQPDIACFQEMVAGENKKSINNIAAMQQALGFRDYYYSFELRYYYSIELESSDYFIELELSFCLEI